MSPQTQHLHRETKCILLEKEKQYQKFSVSSLKKKEMSTYPKSSLAAAKIVDVFPVPGGP